jgi:hypothetical protein
MGQFSHSYLINIIPYKDPNNETRIVKAGLVGYHGIHPSLPSHYTGNVA